MNKGSKFTFGNLEYICQILEIYSTNPTLIFTFSVGSQSASYPTYTNHLKRFKFPVFVNWSTSWQVFCQLWYQLHSLSTAAMCLYSKYSLWHRTKFHSQFHPGQLGNWKNWRPVHFRTKSRWYLLRWHYPAPGFVLDFDNDQGWVPPGLVRSESDKCFLSPVHLPIGCGASLSSKSSSAAQMPWGGFIQTMLSTCWNCGWADYGNISSW